MFVLKYVCFLNVGRLKVGPGRQGPGRRGQAEGAEGPEGATISFIGLILFFIVFLRAKLDCGQLVDIQRPLRCYLIFL